MEVPGVRAHVVEHTRDMSHPITLTELYRLVPAIECKGLCAVSCGPIVIAEAEARRMEAIGGPFRLTLGEGDTDAERLSKGTCGYLKDSRCTVYSVRPLLCRLWGVATPMICPWGCRPARVLSRDEGYALFARLERIGGKWVTPDTGDAGLTLTGPWTP